MFPNPPDPPSQNWAEPVNSSGAAPLRLNKLRMMVLRLSSPSNPEKQRKSTNTVI